MKLFLAMLSALVLSACSSTGSPVASKVQAIDFPEVGIVTKANIGDTIVKKGEVRTIPNIKTRDPVRALAYMTDPLTVPAQTFNLTQTTPDFSVYQGGRYTLCEPKSGNKWRASEGGIEGPCAFPVTSEITVERGESYDVKAPNFIQELIYNGKSGSEVKFLYRELSNDMMRTAFAQDLQYDLEASDVIGFREVRIQIMSATNTEIEYKVLEPFEWNPR